jgi:uncharacterized protein
MMDKTKPAILSAHPIEPAVRVRIIQALDEIEAAHGVKVLFACESGSRGWGFASPDSDYDVRFVYVHKLPWYLTVHAPRDVIELPISDELDVSGWELRKALQLLRKSNPTLLEWLDSPVVYREDAAFAARMRGFVPAFFSGQGVRHHYLSMARKNFRGYLQGDAVRLKKYLYVLRPLLAVRWIDGGRGMPPMRFADLAQATVDDPALVAEINGLLEIKMRAGEAEYSARWPAIHDFIVAELARAERMPEHGRPAGETRDLDRFLAETVQAFSRN